MNKDEVKRNLDKSENHHVWYYEARNGGWWIYEQRTSTEIERAFNASEKSVRLQISGFHYIIDFEEMVQYREDFPDRRRGIKRDEVGAETVKGVAGIVIREARHMEDTGTERGESDAEQQSSAGGELGRGLPGATSLEMPESASEACDEGSERKSRLVTGHD